MHDVFGAMVYSIYNHAQGFIRGRIRGVRRSQPSNPGHNKSTDGNRYPVSKHMLDPFFSPGLQGSHVYVMFCIHMADMIILVETRNSLGHGVQLLKLISFNSGNLQSELSTRLK